jgi:putative addiction module component (TIGR02574 family)
MWFAKSTIKASKLKDISLPHKEMLNVTETSEKLKLELSQLSIQERAEIASFLIHSLDENMDQDIESAWDAELAQRTREIKSGNASGEPSSQVLADLRQKYL